MDLATLPKARKPDLSTSSYHLAAKYHPVVVCKRHHIAYSQITVCFHDRLVTANAPVMKMLKSYLEWRRNLVKEYHFVDNHLFLDKRGNGVPQHELQQAFRLICTKANIVHKDGKNVRLHDLRHSFATHRLVQWYKEGADVQTLLPVLSTYLGHSHLEDTSIYLSMTHELLDKANVCFKTYVESDYE